MFHRSRAGGTPGRLQVKLQYKNQEFGVTLDTGATFGELRYEAAARTGLRTDGFTLKFRGREKGDSEALVTAGLKNGSGVLVQETAVHESIREASFVGLQQAQQAAMQRAQQPPQSVPLAQQQADAAQVAARAQSYSAASPQRGGRSPQQQAAQARPQSYSQPQQQPGLGYHQYHGHGLQQHEIAGARFPAQAGVTSGGSAHNLRPPHPPAAGDTPAWDSTFPAPAGAASVAVDGAAAATPGSRASHMSHQRQHHAQHYAEQQAEVQRRQQELYRQHQEQMRVAQQAREAAEGQANGQGQPKRFVGPMPAPNQTPAQQLLARVAAQEQEMDRFAQQVDELTGGAGECAEAAGARQRKVMLLELLTRVMLALDGVRVPDGGETPPEVRAARKAAVVRAQTLVDRVEAVRVAA